MAPQEPPWPEQRSMTATSAWGRSRSISAALAPMFCARAWQARCRVTPPGQCCQSGRQALLLRDVDHVLADVEGRLREALHALVLRQDQRPLELEHERAGGDERHHVVAALVDAVGVPDGAH